MFWCPGIRSLTGEGCWRVMQAVTCATAPQINVMYAIQGIASLLLRQGGRRHVCRVTWALIIPMLSPTVNRNTGLSMSWKKNTTTLINRLRMSWLVRNIAPQPVSFAICIRVVELSRTISFQRVSGEWVRYLHQTWSTNRHLRITLTG